MSDEWYTPKEIIEAARLAMGGIDTDPASSEEAQSVVKATTFYTADTNGLDKRWTGRVWLNPPYSRPLFGRFAERLVDQIRFPPVNVLGIDSRSMLQMAVMIVPNNTETEATQSLFRHAIAAHFPSSRVRFRKPGGKTGARPPTGHVILAFASRRIPFMDIGEFQTNFQYVFENLIEGVTMTREI